MQSTTTYFISENDAIEFCEAYGAFAEVYGLPDGSYMVEAWEHQ